MVTQASIRRVFLASAVLCAASAAAAHPKPGAHADVRIEIADDAVRIDCLLNILFADQVVNVARAKRDDVAAEEEAAVRSALAEFFGAAREGAVTALVDRPTRVAIDGVAVAPIVRELRIVRPEPETRPGFEQNPALLIPRIHVVAEYPAKSTPKSVSLVWGAFPRDFQAQNRDAAPPADIEAVLTAGGDLDIITFRKSEPEHVWHAPAVGREARFAPVPAVAAGAVEGFAVPAASLGVAALWAAFVIAARSRPAPRPVWAGGGPVAASGVAAGLLAVVLLPALRVPLPQSRPKAALPTEAEALAIFAPLHANIYRAFDYTREVDIYDALARSVDGPLLDGIYGDVYASLIMREEGGALSRVKAVEPLRSEARPATVGADGAARFVVSTRWRVEGVVYHWGHSHARVNEYAAEYDVAARPGGWRIVGSRPLEQRRVQTPEQAASAAALEAASPPPPTVETTPWRPNR